MIFGVFFLPSGVGDGTLGLVLAIYSELYH
jgi:hypothetical protein